MKITKLDLKNFGKFKDRTIELEDGINVIYGHNESGKTTTHRFIQGMFFGFYKPYTKNRIYSQEYDRYRPWNSENYRGSLDFQVGKGKYRIERNFLKGKEDFRFIDEVSGKDLTQRLPYDKTTRQHVISPVLGLNSEMFKNTVSISQLGNRTDDSLKKEISETLVNYENGNDNSISVTKALSTLALKKKDIGTRNQSRSVLGSAVNRLDELKNERKEAVRILDENRDNLARKRDLDRKYRALRQRKDEIDSLNRKNTEKREMNILSKYLKAKAENEELADRLEVLGKYKDIDSSVYASFMDVYSENKSLKEQYSAHEEKLEKLNSDYQEVSDKSSSAAEQTMGKSYRKICSDIDVLKDRLGNIERLEKRLSAKKNDKIEKDFTSKNVTNLIINILLILSIVAAGFMLAFSFSISKELLIYFYIALGLAVVMGIVKIIVSLILRESSKKYVKYDTSLIRTQNMIELNEVEINSILAEYDSDNPYALIEYLEENKKAAMENNEFMAEADKLTIQINDTREAMDILSAKIEENDRKIKLILDEKGIADAAEFKEAFEARRDYESLSDRFEGNEKLINSLEEDNDMDKIMEKYGDSELSSALEDESLDMVDDGEAEKVGDEITDTLREISRINGILEESGTNNVSLSEIDEEIAVCEDIISRSEKKLKSIEKAEETIKDLSSKIHAKAAPDLNERLGSIMSSLTNGKYSTVRVDEDMNVMVLDEKSGMMVDAERLSNGTVDQVYLALRLSIIDELLLSKKMPLIVDDCFIQYDDERLKEVLSYFAKLAENRQIIMFTCQNREEQTMDDLGISYNKTVL